MPRLDLAWTDGPAIAYEKDGGWRRDYERSIVQHE